MDDNKIICELWLNDTLVDKFKYTNDEVGQTLANGFYEYPHYSGRLNITITGNKIIKKYKGDK